MFKWLKILKEQKENQKLTEAHIIQSKVDISTLKQELSQLKARHNEAWIKVKDLSKAQGSLSGDIHSVINKAKEDQEKSLYSLESRVGNVERQMAKMNEDFNYLCEEVRRALPKNKHKKKGN